MSIGTQQVAILTILAAAIVAAWFGSAANLSASTIATPTPAECVAAAVEGTPEATPTPPPATPSPKAAVPTVDAASLMAALEDRGVEVEDTGAIDQPFFNAEEVRRVLISGGSLEGEAEIQVYSYDDVETLEADASQVTPDGNLMTVMIEWIATPHFFCGDQIMVIYIGDDAAAIDLLTEILGPQFAGR